MKRPLFLVSYKEGKGRSPDKVLGLATTAPSPRDKGQQAGHSQGGSLGFKSSGLISLRPHLQPRWPSSSRRHSCCQTCPGQTSGRWSVRRVKGGESKSAAPPHCLLPSGRVRDGEQPGRGSFAETPGLGWERSPMQKAWALLPGLAMS